ncbi:MAG TPA: hypothetical protein VGK57_11180, partial [Candidatus Binatia bacterium]
VGSASIFKMDLNGVVTTPYLLKPPIQRRWAYLAATGTSSTVLGDISTTTGTVAFNEIVSPETTYATAATTGSNAGTIGNLIWDRQHSPRFQFRGYNFSTANRRVWYGLTSVSLATQVGSDSPAASYAAFRASTDAGDGNWQACTKDGTTATCIDTGVAVSTVIFDFEIILDGSVPNAIFKINGAVVATATTNLPGAATQLAAMVGQQTRANAAKTIGLNWLYVETSNN